jgi:hypothetical protein
MRSESETTQRGRANRKIKLQRVLAKIKREREKFKSVRVETLTVQLACRDANLVNLHCVSLEPRNLHAVRHMLDTCTIGR